MITYLMSRLISAVRGEKYTVDATILPVEIYDFVSMRLTMLVRGFLFYPFRAFRFRLFVGRGVQMLGLSNCDLPRTMTVNANCFLNFVASERCRLGQNFTIGRHSEIVCTSVLSEKGTGFCCGDNVGIGSHSHIGCQGGVEIGAGTIIGPYFKIFSEDHNYGGACEIRHQGVTRDRVVIGKNCWIGCNVTILKGVVVGDNCVIGANALITKSIPDNVLAVGRNTIVREIKT